MKLDKANTEPFRRLHDFHVSLNDTLKILTACVRHTFATTRNGSHDLGTLITNADAAWKYPPMWKSADRFEDDVLARVCALGIVNVFSAADDFMDGVEAEISRWKHYSKKDWPIAEVDDDDRFAAMAKRHGASYTSIERDLPVIKYFSLVRNCIAHRNGRASKALEAFSNSKPLADALAKFERRPGEGVPSFKYNEEIRLLPTQAIFYSHVVREAGQAISKRVVDVFGEDGVLRMAVHHTFLAETESPRFS